MKINKKMIADLRTAMLASADASKKANALANEYIAFVKGPEMRALIGRTYKYPKNCYSCPEKASDYWPVYARVVGVGKDGTTLKIVSFETDSRGDFTYRRNDWWDGVGSGYEPCSDTEYQKEFKKQVARLLP